MLCRNYVRKVAFHPDCSCHSVPDARRMKAPCTISSSTQRPQSSASRFVRKVLMDAGQPISLTSTDTVGEVDHMTHCPRQAKAEVRVAAGSTPAQ